MMTCDLNSISMDKWLVKAVVLCCVRFCDRNACVTSHASQDLCDARGISLKLYSIVESWGAQCGWQSSLAALAVWIDSWHFSPISSMPWAWLGHWQYSCKQFWESGMQAWSLLTVESQGFRQLHWWWLMPNFWLVPWRKDAALSIQKRFSKLQCSGIKSHMYPFTLLKLLVELLAPMTIFILRGNSWHLHGFLLTSCEDDWPTSKQADTSSLRQYVFISFPSVLNVAKTSFSHWLLLYKQGHFPYKLKFEFMFNWNMQLWEEG